MWQSLYTIFSKYIKMSESVLYKILFVDSHRVCAKFLTGSTLALCVIDKTDNYTCILYILVLYVFTV